MIHKEVRNLERFLGLGSRANGDGAWAVVLEVHIPKVSIGNWEGEEQVVVD